MVAIEIYREQRKTRLGMDVTNIPLMAALKSRMKWHNNNQSVISENIAHADTPGFKAKELSEQDFSGLVDELSSGGGTSMQMRANNARHMNATGATAGAGAEKQETKDGEESPTGNSVVLEEEMMKLANNQMKYGMVVNLYKKNMGLLNIALGKSGKS